jgi:LPS sulfotransferase NodH
MSSVNNFVIVSSARSGSNFLVSLLNNSFTRVQCFGEVFKEGFVASDYDVGLAETLAIDIVSFPSLMSGEKLQRLIDGSTGTLWVCGSKIFMYHARAPEENSVWDMLRAGATPLIGLLRNNLLDRYVSLKYAERSGQWMSLDANAFNDSGQITIDIENLARFFHESEVQDDEVRTLVGSDGLMLDFDELVTRTDQVIAQLSGFLGLQPTDAPASFVHKQSSRPMASKVSNYTAVKNHFDGGRFAHFFH